jgi:hypothetical protein
MQGYRILCVTTHKDSEKMWTGYAQNHEGIALRIEPNVEKDSKFQRFFPVQYRRARPSLYDDTLAFLEGSLFGDQEAMKRAMLDKIIYSKTLEWEHESEYRLAIPLRRGEKEWDTLPYHPEEITEMYLGLAMTKETRLTLSPGPKRSIPTSRFFRRDAPLTRSYCSTSFNVERVTTDGSAHRACARSRPAPPSGHWAVGSDPTFFTDPIFPTRFPTELLTTGWEMA